MESKCKVVESSVPLERCENSESVEVCSNETQAEPDKVLIKLEIEEYRDDAATVDWIKREQTVQETESFHVKMEIVENEPMHPCPPVSVMPKMEPTSPKREPCVEEPTPGCSSAASAVSHARKRMHTGEIRFSCAICNSIFTLLGDLDRHMLIHTGDRPFRCTICDKKFAQSCLLKKHLRIHTGERPFHCEICDAKFSFTFRLTRHMRTHTGDRPFSCTNCDAKFIELGNLKTHMRIHTRKRPFNCTVCDANTQSSVLKRHMRLHTGERPFSCTVCDAKFIDPTSLKKHMCTIVYTYS